MKPAGDTARGDPPRYRPPMPREPATASAHPDAVAALLRRRVARDPIELPVSGVSMAGVIASDSTVVIVTASQPRRGEIWAFVDDEGGIVVHRVREYDGTSVTARGAGNPIDDAPVSTSRLVGKVVEARHESQRRRFGRIDRIRADLAMKLRASARRTIPRAVHRRFTSRRFRDRGDSSESLCRESNHRE